MLCEPWQIATFPAPDERPEQFRVLFFSCAGGHEAMKFLPPAVRNRLFRRALSFEPQAAVANGDHDALASDRARGTARTRRACGSCVRVPRRRPRATSARRPMAR